MNENKRLIVQTKLEELLGSRKVYYQPPENLKMEYPCIRYSRGGISNHHADDINYIGKTRYDIVVIDKSPDNDVIGKILELPLSSYDRHYISDGLHHDIITYYY